MGARTASAVRVIRKSEISEKIEDNLRMQEIFALRESPLCDRLSVPTQYLLHPDDRIKDRIVISDIFNHILKNARGIKGVNSIIKCLNKSTNRQDFWKRLNLVWRFVVEVRYDTSIEGKTDLWEGPSPTAV